MRAQIIASAMFETRERKFEARLFMPALREGTWGCRFEIDAPISVSQDVYGETSIQALALALKLMATHLYGSDLYRAKQLGAFGEFGGYLGLPAPAEVQAVAPYPF
jgi:hypothetical protein